MNNKEHIKSVILALLVLMSVVLTYMVWNFSPKYPAICRQYR
ncbi:two-component system activity regulator YycH [Staphylococcus aureus]